MALKIVQNLTPYNFSDASRGKDDIKYIVIHYFGSLGTARAVANYFASAYRGASAHYSLDEGDTVYQSVREEDIAWHCGTSGDYVHPVCRNRNSIGIEVRPYKLDPSTASSAAVRDWYFTPEIVDNLVEFTRALMEKYNIPPENVIRHYDVTGKWCPRPYMGDDINEYYNTSGNEQWRRFKARLVADEEDFDMSKDELKGLIREVVKEVLDEENPVYKDLKDVPDYWRPTAAALLDAGAVNGGTPEEVCDTDLNLRKETLKAIIVSVAYHEANT